MPSPTSSANSTTNAADSPTCTQAINSPHAKKWWEVIKSKLATFESDLQAWELVLCESWMHILPSRWAFCLKSFPNGLVKKFKAHFCIRGDMQVEGVDFFETWAPVVQWTMVLSMMVLATRINSFLPKVILQMLSFMPSLVLMTTHMCVSQPVFNLTVTWSSNSRSLSTAFANPPRTSSITCLTIRDTRLGASTLGPCQFVGKSMVVVVYVDYLLIYATTDSEIDHLISSLQAAGIYIHYKGTAEGFLGVDIVCTSILSIPQITLIQVGLTKHIIKAVGLCSSLSTPIGIPAETSPLPKDAVGHPTSGSFNYEVVVGMLLYLSDHSCPNIAFAVHQCAHYTFHPTHHHELALIRIGCYLKGTLDKSLMLSPSSTPHVDCYPDADFAGLYGHEDSMDPQCACSRTGYVIMAFDCPVLWYSCLQTEIALSTVEAEYVAISMACKDLLPP
jgi:hypothetical protein